MEKKRLIGYRSGAPVPVWMRTSRKKMFPGSRARGTERYSWICPGIQGCVKKDCTVFTQSLQTGVAFTEDGTSRSSRKGGIFCDVVTVRSKLSFVPVEPRYCSVIWKSAL